MNTKVITFAGTDARSLLCAIEAGKSNNGSGIITQGVVIRGNSAMQRCAKIFEWPIRFIPTDDNSTASYCEAIVSAIKTGSIDYVIPMPESLQFNGMVDTFIEAGHGGCIAGLTKKDSFLEANKIEAKLFCDKYAIPVADDWNFVDARDKASVLRFCLDYLDRFGGAVLKYPFSAAGKGSRIIRSTWEINDVYKKLMEDYSGDYEKQFGAAKDWPLLIESLMAGVEISFMVLVDANGNFAILPTALDYPERFARPAGVDDLITGGMGSISAHPFASEHLMDLAAKTIIKPLINGMKQESILRPCILYPGCFVSQNHHGDPTRIRVSEINIRMGEPEGQTAVRLVKNFGELIVAMMTNRLNEVNPILRDNQISMTIALVTGPGGPQGQKGYPWSCTKGEEVLIDYQYLKKKGITLLPSAMIFNDKEKMLSDGTRVAYLLGNAEVKDGNTAEAAERLRNKLYGAFEGGKIRVVPRENPNGNRLDLRPDIGLHFSKANIFQL